MAVTFNPLDRRGRVRRRRTKRERPCRYCTDPVLQTGMRGHPREYHPICRRKATKSIKITERYRRCLSNGGHKPSGQVVVRPGYVLPLRVCRRCQVPYTEERMGQFRPPPEAP